MFYTSPPGSAERHRFLEEAQSSMLEDLTKQAVVQALGTSAVERLQQANDLLIIPNIRGNRVVMPRSSRSSEAIPFLAVKHGETMELDTDDIAPTPRQIHNIRTLMDSWADTDGTTTAKQAESRAVRLVRQRVPEVASYQLERKTINGGVVPYAVGIYGRELGLAAAPKGFYLRLRPAVGLAYKGRYAPQLVLAHELIHLDQFLSTAINSGDPSEGLKDAYRHELEAYHYSALYAESRPAPNRAAALWMYPEIAQHTQVETIRKEFADQAHPFEPTMPMIKKLDENGIRWEGPTGSS